MFSLKNTHKMTKASAIVKKSIRNFMHSLTIILLILVTLLSLIKCDIQNSSNMVASCTIPKWEVNTGNFVSCSGFNKFPNAFKNPTKVNFLDMSQGNNLEHLIQDQHAQTFEYLFNLILRNCHIQTIQKEFFSKIGKNIVDLDLSKNKIIVLDPEFFVALYRLQILNLRENPIVRFQEGIIFPPLQNLKQMDLSSCLLSTVPENVFDALSLKELKLNNNHLTSLSWRMFKFFGHFSITLEENPWKCDCHLKFLIETLKPKLAFRTTQDYKCELSLKKDSVVPIKWSQVNDEDFFCAPQVDEIILVEGYSKAGFQNNFRLSCKFYGYPQPEIYWLKNGKPIKRSRGSKLKRNDVRNNYEKTRKFSFNEVLFLRNITRADIGVYTCRAVNLAGEAEETVYLSVNGTKPFMEYYSYPAERHGMLSGWHWFFIVALSIINVIVLGLIIYFVFKELKKRANFRQNLRISYENSIANPKVKIHLQSNTVSTPKKERQPTPDEEIEKENDHPSTATNSCKSQENFQTDYKCDDKETPE